MYVLHCDQKNCPSLHYVHIMYQRDFKNFFSIPEAAAPHRTPQIRGAHVTGLVSCNRIFHIFCTPLQDYLYSYSTSQICEHQQNLGMSINLFRSRAVHNTKISWKSSWRCKTRIHSHLKHCSCIIATCKTYRFCRSSFHAQQLVKRWASRFRNHICYTWSLGCH